MLVSAAFSSFENDSVFNQKLPSENHFRPVKKKEKKKSIKMNKICNVKRSQEKG